MYAPTPNSKIKLLRGVPVDKNYNHTVYFVDAAGQRNTWLTYVAYSAEQAQYNRETGRIRFPGSADTLRSCNYLMYQNTGYTNKWFYAFINQVYYINDNMTEIDFSIDIMQTFMFDYTLGDCFIERSHTATDVAGDNRVAETINFGSYHVLDMEPLTDVEDWDIIMYSSFDPSTYQSAGGSLNKGLYSGLDRTIIGRVHFDLSTNPPTPSFAVSPQTTIADIINNHADKAPGVVAIVIAPHQFEVNNRVITTIPKPTGNQMYGSYTVKNKKLLIAPFTVVYVFDGSGTGKMYDPAEFEGNNIVFHCFSDNAPAQSVIALPYNYNNVAGVNPAEGVIMSSFPQCAWISDAFKTYLAQNQANIGVSTGLAAASIAAAGVITIATEGAALPIAAGLVVGGASAAGKVLANVEDAKKQPPAVHGNVTGTALYTIGNKRLIAYIMTPHLEYIKIIDDYFSMYGYAINRVQTPVTMNRPHWTYLKTLGCIVLPNPPISPVDQGLSAADCKEIAAVYDKGITFWRYAAEVGEYYLDNTV